MTVITASGVPEKTMSVSVADGQAASAQIAKIQWAVGGPLVKHSADLWGFVRWATTTHWLQPLPPVDSHIISGGPPLTRQLMYMAVDEMVISC